MAGVGDRVKKFLESWDKRRARELLDPEDARCKTCGALLVEGCFIMDDGYLICLNCMKGF